MTNLAPSRRAPCVGLSQVLVALAVAVFPAGCDTPPDRPAPEVSEPVSQPGSVGAGADTAAGSLGIEAAQGATADSGNWRPLSVPSPTDPDTYPLLVINPHRVPLIVLADGGAGEVLLDTVAAEDSTRLRLLIGADSVTLRTVGPDGTTGPADRIGLVRQPGTRWEARY